MVGNFTHTLPLVKDSISKQALAQTSSQLFFFFCRILPHYELLRDKAELFILLKLRFAVSDWAYLCSLAFLQVTTARHWLLDHTKPDHHVALRLLLQ